MVIFYILLVISVLGVATVLLLLRKEEKEEDRLLPKIPIPLINPALGSEATLPSEGRIIEQEISLTAQRDQWMEKYQRLDKLFQEESAALTKAEELLQAEVNNRKGFNKLKDILEKELKDAKDKTRITQVELNASQAEGERYKERINYLEEKVTRLEKAIFAKEEEMTSLLKSLKANHAGVVTTTAPEDSALGLAGGGALPKSLTKLPLPSDSPISEKKE